MPRKRYGWAGFGCCFNGIHDNCHDYGKNNNATSYSTTLLSRPQLT